MSAAANGQFYCSFCGRNTCEVKTIVVSESANICNECVETAQDNLREHWHKEWLRLKDFAP